MRFRLDDRLDAVAVVQPIPERRHRDWLLAALLGFFAALTIGTDDMLPLWAEVLPTVVAVGFVPFRREIPLVAVVAMSVVTVLCVALGLPDATIGDVGSPVGVTDVVLVYALCRWAPPAHVAIGLPIAAGADAAVGWLAGRTDINDAALLFPWLVVAALALAMRYRARAIESQLEHARLTERNALARELHDTVAHHVSAIAVQAQAGQYVARSNASAATEALASVERIANNSIDEMRRMVVILRSDDDRDRSVAPETLDVLADETGSPAVHVRGDTTLADLPATIGAGLFRVAQESITNARRHSRGVTMVEVTVQRHIDRIEMTVDNNGSPTGRQSGGGFGVIGMRERVETLGGTFESAAMPSYGWRTSTSIPWERMSR